MGQYNTVFSAPGSRRRPAILELAKRTVTALTSIKQTESLPVTETQQPQVLVVGAGVCGLTVAERLAARGVRVAVVEREAAPGGLARTFHYPEGSFDIGPHRFHTTDRAVLNYLDEVLGAEVRHIPRLSLVHFHKHFYRWPIHPTMHLLRLPWRMIVGVAFDLLFRLYRKKKPESFEDYILNMYGRTLYRTFFRDYTTKFLGLDPGRTHADWAMTGIDRAIIDERLKIHTLGELIKSVLIKSKEAEVQFRYPPGGVDRFAAKLIERIVAAGGRVHLGEPVTAAETKDGRLTAIRTPGHVFEPEQVVWTASPAALLGMLGRTPPPLRLLDLVCYNVVTPARRGPDFQWCYFGSPALLFSRVSRPEDFDPSMMPAGRHGLCVEVTAPEQSPVWEKPEQFTDRVLQDLRSVGLLAADDPVSAIHIERIPEAYPIYSLGYDVAWREAQRALSEIAGLHPAGRTGTFWYNNMDHSIAMALRLADELTASPTK